MKVNKVSILENGLPVRFWLCNLLRKKTEFRISPGQRFTEGKKERFVNPVFVECDENNVVATNNPEIIDFILNDAQHKFEYAVKTKEKGETVEKVILNELFVGISPFDEKYIDKERDVTYNEYYKIKDIKKNAEKVIKAHGSKNLADNSASDCQYRFRQLGNFSQRFGLASKTSEEINTNILERQNKVRKKALDIYDAGKDKKLGNDAIIKNMESAGIPGKIIEDDFLLR